MVPSGEAVQEINAMTRSFLKSVRILLLISAVCWGGLNPRSSITESNSCFVCESQGTVSKTEVEERLLSLQNR